MTSDTQDRIDAGGDQVPEARTERVRIVGAQRAGGDVPPDAGATDDEESGSFGLNDWQEPLAEPELPHWTEAPTGEIPAVLAGPTAGDGGADAWPSVPEPTWREREADWEHDAAAFEPALLADDQEPTELPDRQPWAFELGGQAQQDDESAGWTGAGSVRWEPEPATQDWLDEPASRWAADPGPQDEPTTAVPVTRGLATDDVELGASSSIAAEEGAEALEADRRSRGRRGRWGERRARRVDREEDDDYVGMRVPVGADVGLAARSSVGAVTTETGRLSVSSRNVTRPRPAPGGADRLRPGAGRPSDAGTDSGRNIPVAIATGVIIGVIVLVAFHFGPVPAMVVVTAIVALAAMEMYGAFRNGGYHPATLLGLVATVSVMIAAYTKGPRAIPIVVVLLVALTVIWHLVGVDARADPVRLSVPRCWSFAGSACLDRTPLLLAPSDFPHRHGVAFLIGAIISAVFYDIGALAAGSWFGRHPLSAASPNKTWEGLLGGTVVCLIFTVAIVHAISPWTLAKAALLGLVVSVVSPLGDLGESLLKRRLGLKDMGRMLPGHGGFMDRVDGLLFVLPATFYMVSALHFA